MPEVYNKPQYDHSKRDEIEPVWFKVLDKIPLEIRRHNVGSETHEEEKSCDVIQSYLSFSAQKRIWNEMRTEKQAIKVAGEQANVEICGGGETVDQRRDGVQDEHRCGARSVQCVVIGQAMVYPPVV
jgi:hypothetical protein